MPGYNSKHEALPLLEIYTLHVSTLAATTYDQALQRGSVRQSKHLLIHPTAVRGCQAGGAPVGLLLEALHLHEYHLHRVQQQSIIREIRIWIQAAMSGQRQGSMERPLIPEQQSTATPCIKTGQAKSTSLPGCFPAEQTLRRVADQMSCHCRTHGDLL